MQQPRTLSSEAQCLLLAASAAARPEFKRHICRLDLDADELLQTILLYQDKSNGSIVIKDIVAGSKAEKVQPVT